MWFCSLCCWPRCICLQSSKSAGASSRDDHRSSSGAVNFEDLDFTDWFTGTSKWPVKPVIKCCLYFNFDYDVIELIQHPINLMRTCWGGSCNIVPEAIRLCHGKLIILSGQHPKSCQRYYLVKTGWWFGTVFIMMVNTWVVTIVNDGWWWLIVVNYTGWWWLEPWNLRNFHILGMSWSQLPFICFRGVGIPPTRKCWTN